MQESDIIKQVRRIEIRARGLSQQMFSGEYHSAFKGRGMAFSEVREYQYGDDVRNIDWNVTARLNHPYVKVFEEERELTVMLLIDVSGSHLFGTTSQYKSELIAETAATLAFSAIHNNDKVGVVMFSDKIEKFIPPKKGSSHILRIIRELIGYKPEGRGTDISEALRYFTNITKKRSTAFLMSDMIDDDYENALSYWHTHTGYEVDAVLGDANVAIEIKSCQEVQSRHLRGLKAFGEEHPNARLIIVSLDVAPRTFNNVEVMPATHFLQELWNHKIYQP